MRQVLSEIINLTVLELRLAYDTIDTTSIELQDVYKFSDEAKRELDNARGELERLNSELNDAQYKNDDPLEVVKSALRVIPRAIFNRFRNIVRRS